jgi:hypothetical protein
MIEEKRKMDPPIKSEDDRVWVAEDDRVWVAEDDRVWVAEDDRVWVAKLTISMGLHAVVSFNTRITK